jgi:hypothetical protein
MYDLEPRRELRSHRLNQIARNLNSRKWCCILWVIPRRLILCSNVLEHSTFFIFIGRGSHSKHSECLKPKICEERQCVLGQFSVSELVNKLLTGLGSTAKPRSPAHDPGRRVSHEYDQCLRSSLPS